jgi:hypothetical protein
MNMRKILFATTALAAPTAFMSETLEVVNIKGADGKPVRVNKSDYDADQAGDKKMTLHKDEAEPAVAGVQSGGWPDNLPPMAAPAAPDFNGPQDAGNEPPLIDPVKNAVAPPAPPPNSLFVIKEGTGTKAKFVVVDGTGAKVTDRAGIDKDGYATELAAQQAIAALPTG